MDSLDDEIFPIADTSKLLESAALASLHPTTYPAGTVLFRIGDTDDMIYIILSGEVEVARADDGSGRPLSGVFGPDSVIGFMAVFGRDIPTHEFNGRTVTEVQALVVPRNEINMLLQREPLVAYKLLHMASIEIYYSHIHALRDMEAKNAQLEQANYALRAAQAQLLEHERLQHELHLAREIQEQMLPQVLPQVREVDIGARIIPAREVSGDFFDLFMLNDETLGIVIGDVCGKGMPAALYMAQSRSLLRSAAGRPEAPDQVLRVVNGLLRDMNSGSMFVTCILVRLHLPTRTLEMARAGHEYPLLFGADGTSRPLPRTLGQPLGILDDPSIDAQTITLAPGDTLLLYTDGVTEAMDQTGGFFGGEQLNAAAQTAGATTAQGLCDHIIAQVAAFQGAAPQADDITLVALRAV